jgi:hypothetical protein
MIRIIVIAIKLDAALRQKWRQRFIGADNVMPS